MPFKAESALASLIKRTQERAIPVAELDAQIPGALSGIVSKCIERDLEFRYKSVSDVLKDLRTWEASTRFTSCRLTRRPSSRYNFGCG